MVGVGNFGKVLRAYNKVEKRFCALKVIEKESIALMKHTDHIISEKNVLSYLTRKEEDSEGCPFLLKIYSTL